MDPREELEALRRLKELESKELASQRGGMDRSVLSGAASGIVGGTIGMPGDLREMIGSTGVYDKLPMFLRPPQFPTTEDILRVGQDATGLPLTHKPEGAKEKYAHSIVEGTAGMALPSGKIKAGIRLLAGALGGGAGEATRQATDSGLAGAGIQTLATLLALIPGAKKPQIVKAIGDEIKDLSSTVPQPKGPFRPTDKELVPEALRRAEEKAADVAALTGVRPVLSQAIDQPTSLSGVTREVTASPSGAKLDQTLNAETIAGHKTIDEVIAKISELPIGTDTANRINEAGMKARARPGKVAAASSARDYRMARKDVLPADNYFPHVPEKGEIPSQFGKEIIDVFPESGKPNNYFVPPTDARRLSQDLIKRIDVLNLEATPSNKSILDEVEKIRQLARDYPDGIPVLKLDAQRRVIQDRIARIDKGLETDTGAITSLNGLKAVSGAINDAIKGSSQALSDGKDRFSRWSKAYGDKVEKSPIPDLFPESAARGDYSTMTKIITESTRYGRKDIEFVAQNLRRADPEAFPAMVKQAWNETWEKAKLPAAGRSPEQAMNDWARQVGGAPGSQIRENYLETVKQIQLSRGGTVQQAQAAAAGADKVMDALFTFSRDRGGLGEINPAEMRRMAGSNYASSSVRALSVMPAWGASRAWERVLWKKTYEEIADALTSPGGAQKLIEISQFSQPQLAAEAFVRSLVAGNLALEDSPR